MSSADDCPGAGAAGFLEVCPDGGYEPSLQKETVMTETTLPDPSVLTETELSHAVSAATIDAPIEKVDLYEWLRTRPDAEYQRCAPPDHKAAGYTVTDDGRPMSINVEMIGTGLVIQHYVYEVAEKDHLHMVSISDVLSPAGWTTCQVIWCLQADP